MIPLRARITEDHNAAQQLHGGQFLFWCFFMFPWAPLARVPLNLSIWFIKALPLSFSLQFTQNYKSTTYMVLLLEHSLVYGEQVVLPWVTLHLSASDFLAAHAMNFLLHLPRRTLGMLSAQVGKSVAGRFWSCHIAIWSIQAAVWHSLLNVH